jgi:molybdenum-dependent DNA-binding transcriptional regulator ModE
LNYTSTPFLEQTVAIFSTMSRPLVPKIRILIGAVVAIGPGRADLLGAIARTGSISGRCAD